MPPYIVGLGAGAALIVAIGAQNAFVLRAGMRGQHVFIVAAICAASDAILVTAGVGGLGLALQAVPWLIDIIRWGGAAFLLCYAALAFLRAWRPNGAALAPWEAPAVDPGATAPAHAGDAMALRTQTASMTATVLTALALTWLNPHVYLDTVIFLGSLANAQGTSRWLFAAGAVTASILWFFGLAYGAKALGRWLASPRAWRLVDATTAVVMLMIALSLILGA